MALPASGTISLNQCHIELGASSGSAVSMNDSDMRSLAGVSSGAISLSNFHGKANELVFAAAFGPQNGYKYQANITVSSISGFSSGMTLRIPSDTYIQGGSSGNALIIDIPCTIINEGRIIGKGGKGGSYGYPSFMNPSSGGNGETAINVTSSGVTIINQSSGFIAGGGGGGAVGYDNSGTHGSAHYVNAGGGGGAGGGLGGRGGATGVGGGSAGSVNGTGGNGTGNGSDAVGGLGGGAGGGGDSILNYANNNGGVGGGGGGKILPGVGGGNGLSGTTANGGSAGAAGNGVGGGVTNVSGGGGGWGASGGAGQGGYFLGSGGAAITGTSRTLVNNGTIYGST